MDDWNLVEVRESRQALAQQILHEWHLELRPDVEEPSQVVLAVLHDDEVVAAVVAGEFVERDNVFVVAALQRVEFTEIEL